MNLDGYCGYAEIGEGKDIVGIIGHLDVVPEGDGWKHPAYSGELVNNEIWGRGTIDDKGPIIISMYAIKALMDEGFKFNKRVRVIFGCNEETNSYCMEHYLKVEEPITYGVTPDSDFPVIFAENPSTTSKSKANPATSAERNSYLWTVVSSSTPCPISALLRLTAPAFVQTARQKKYALLLTKTA